jgi:hypothetical protein
MGFEIRSGGTEMIDAAYRKGERWNRKVSTRKEEMEGLYAAAKSADPSIPAIAIHVVRRR